MVRGSEQPSLATCQGQNSRSSPTVEDERRTEFAVEGRFSRVPGFVQCAKSAFIHACWQGKNVVVVVGWDVPPLDRPREPKRADLRVLPVRKTPPKFDEKNPKENCGGRGKKKCTFGRSPSRPPFFWFWAPLTLLPHPPTNWPNAVEKNCQMRLKKLAKCGHGQIRFSQARILLSVPARQTLTHHSHAAFTWTHTASCLSPQHDFDKWNFSLAPLIALRNHALVGRLVKGGEGWEQEWSREGVTNFGQTKFGQDVLPSLASTKFGQTKFGQHQVWPIQVWPAPFCDCNCPCQSKRSEGHMSREERIRDCRGLLRSNAEENRHCKPQRDTASRARCKSPSDSSKSTRSSAYNWQLNLKFEFAARRTPGAARRIAAAKLLIWRLKRRGKKTRSVSTQADTPSWSRTSDNVPHKKLAKVRHMPPVTASFHRRTREV